MIGIALAIAAVVGVVYAINKGFAADKVATVVADVKYAETTDKADFAVIKTEVVKIEDAAKTDIAKL